MISGLFSLIFKGIYIADKGYVQILVAFAIYPVGEFCDVLKFCDLGIKLGFERFLGALWGFQGKRRVMARLLAFWGSGGCKSAHFMQV